MGFNNAFLANAKSGFVLFFSLAILGGSLMIFSFIIILVVPLFGVPFREIQNILSSIPNAETINIFRFVQVMQFLFIFIVPSIFIGFLAYINPFKYLRFHKSIDGRLFLLVLVSIILAIPFINILAYANKLMVLPEFMSGIENWMKEKEDSLGEMTMAFLNVNSISGLFFNIFMIGVLPAIAEEMVFRGIIQKQLIDFLKSKHLGIWITAFFFSAIHFQFYGFLPRFVLGLYLGYVFFWTKNIWYPILAHFANNTMVVVVYFFINKSSLDFNIDEMGISGETVFFGLASTVVSIFAFVLLYRYSVSAPSNRHDL